MKTLKFLPASALPDGCFGGISFLMELSTGIFLRLIICFQLVHITDPDLVLADYILPSLAQQLTWGSVGRCHFFLLVTAKKMSDPFE